MRKMLELSYHFQLPLWTHFFNLYHIVKLLWVVLNMIVYKEPLMICLSSVVVSRPIIRGFKMAHTSPRIHSKGICPARVSWVWSYSPCIPLTAASWDISSATGGYSSSGSLSPSKRICSLQHGFCALIYPLL